MADRPTRFSWWTRRRTGTERAVGFVAAMVGYVSLLIFDGPWWRELLQLAAIIIAVTWGYEAWQSRRDGSSAPPT